MEKKNINTEQNDFMVNYEMKKNASFFVEFPEQFNIREWSLIKINKPKFKNGKWENIKMVFVDPIGPSTSESLFEVIRYLKEKDRKNEFFLFNIAINSLDPTGVVIERWVINVADVYIDFGDLNYKNDKIQKVRMIVKPFDCYLKK